MKIDGLKVVDPMRKLRIHVSPQDVKNAKKKDPSSCAAALCAVREVPGCTEARVHLGRTYLKIGKQWQRYQTPRYLHTELVSFDRGGGFVAGEYTLSPLSESQHLGVGYGSNKGRTKVKALQKKRAPYHVVTGVRPKAAKR